MYEYWTFITELRQKTARIPRLNVWDSKREISKIKRSANNNGRCCGRQASYSNGDLINIKRSLIIALNLNRVTNRWKTILNETFSTNIKEYGSQYR